MAFQCHTCQGPELGILYSNDKRKSGKLDEMPHMHTTDLFPITADNLCFFFFLAKVTALLSPFYGHLIPVDQSIETVSMLPGHKFGHPLSDALALVATTISCLLKSILGFSNFCWRLCIYYLFNVTSQVVLGAKGCKTTECSI